MPHYNFCDKELDAKLSYSIEILEKRTNEMGLQLRREFAGLERKVERLADLLAKAQLEELGGVPEKTCFTAVESVPLLAKERQAKCKHQYDLLLANFMTDMFKHIEDSKIGLDGVGWTLVQCDKFGQAYYLQCRKCGLTVNGI